MAFDWKDPLDLIPDSAGGHTESPFEIVKGWFGDDEDKPAENDVHASTKDILAGKRSLQDYSSSYANKINDYWTNSPKAAFGAGVTPEQAQELERQRIALLKKRELSSNPFFNALEWAGSKITWAYSNSISPIASTTALNVRNVASGEVFGRIEDEGFHGLTSYIKETARSSWHISPGQSLWSIGMSDKDLEGKGIDLKTYSAIGRTKVEDVEDVNLKADAIKVEKAKQAYFASGAQKWVSGTGDFAVSWYADPLVLAGKSVGAIKAAHLAIPTTKTTSTGEAIKAYKGLMAEAAAKRASADTIKQQAGKLQLEAQQAAQRAAKAVGTPDEEKFAKLAEKAKAAAVAKSEAVKVAKQAGLGVKNKMDAIKAAKAPTLDQSVVHGNVVDSFSKYLMSLKGKYSDPEVLTAAMNDSLSTVRKAGGDGRLFTNAVIAARDENEVRLVLQASIGDARALEELTLKNRRAAHALMEGRKELAALDNSLAGMTQGSAKYIQTQQAITQQQNLIRALQEEDNFYSNGVEAVGAKLNAIHFNERLTPLAFQLRQVSKGNEAASSLPGILGGSGVTSSLLRGGLTAPMRLHHLGTAIKPTGYINVHEPQSVGDLDAVLRNSPLEAAYRQRLVGKYSAATPEQRAVILMEAEAAAMSKLAAKYNVSPAVAKELYERFSELRAGHQEALAQHSAAKIADPKDPTQMINVTHIDAAGVAEGAHPILVTQMLNNHSMMDFKRMEKYLKLHEGALGRLHAGAPRANAAATKFSKDALERLGTGTPKSEKALTEILEGFDKYWKFGALFRLGYPIRALSDDFLGQVARYGAVAMAARTLKGVSRSKFVRGRYLRSEKAADEITIDILGVHVKNLESEAASHGAAIEKHFAKGNAAYPTGPLTTAQRRKIAASRQRSLARSQAFQQRLRTVEDELAQARETQGHLINKRATTMHEQIFSHGHMFPGAFDGHEGDVASSMINGDRNVSNMMGRKADYDLAKSRSGRWIIIEAKGNERVHAQAWTRDVNLQIGQDPLARLAVEGKTEQEMINWLGGPAGQAHMKSLGLENMERWDLAGRVKAHVDHYLPPTAPGMDAIRRAVLDGNATGDMLKKAFPDAAHRPEVHHELLKHSLGKSEVSRMADAVINNFYKGVSEIPTAYLLRNPLFAQIYAGSIRQQMKDFSGSGLTHLSEEMRKRMITTARNHAIGDVKKFTFNMDHETKVAYWGKHGMAFLGAQVESWQRWGRIIAEKPQVAGYANLLYTSPIKSGTAIDDDGNIIDHEGYVTKETINPITGKKEKYKVLASRSNMLIQVPPYLAGNALAKAFGGDAKTGVTVPMSALNFTVPNDFSSLVNGPMVQVAANSFVNWGDEEGKPGRADLMNDLGFLPFGAKESNVELVVPAWMKAAGVATGLTGADTRARMKDTLMRQEDYKFRTGQRDEPPTWEEIDRKARRNYWITFMSKESGFSFEKGADEQSNPYEFYNQKFRQMVETYGFEEGHQRYLDKYGDSADLFADSIVANNAGIQATAEAVKVYGENRNLIESLSDTRMASVVVGMEGDGVYSKGAVYTQEGMSVTRGSENRIRQIKDPEQARKERNVSLGWLKYNKFLGVLEADLYDAGFTSFNDRGAEEFKEQKQSLLGFFATETINGKPNQSFNPDWYAEFTSVNPHQYDLRVMDLEKIVNDPAMKAKARNKDDSVGMRSDIASLSKYLSARRVVKSLLAERKSMGMSDDITADENRDLRLTFSAIVDDLREKDTRFGYLQSRWLSSDMGYGMTKDEFEAQQRVDAAKEAQ